MAAGGGGSPNTDRGGATRSGSSRGTKGSATGAGGMFGGGGGGNKSSSASKSSPAKGGSTGKGPGASQAAAKANATKTQAAKTPAKTQTAGRVPGTSAAAAKNTALGKAAQAAKQNIGGGYSNPVTMSGMGYDGINARFSKSLPGLNAAGNNVTRGATTFGSEESKIKPGGWEKQFNNRAGVPVVNFQGTFADGGWRQSLSPEGQNLYNAIVDTAFRTDQPVTFFSGKRPGRGQRGFSPNHSFGYALDSYMRNPVTGVPVGQAELGKYGLGRAASFPIGSASSTLGTTPAEARQIAGVLAGPYQDFSNKVFDTVYQSPGMYGTTVQNLRYGGVFGNGNPFKGNAADYMHHDVTPNRSQQASLHNTALARAEQRGPLGSGTMMAGGALPAGGISGTQPGAAPAPSRLASAALGSIPRPVPRPANLRQTVPKPNPRPLQSFVAQDPRLGLPPGAFPSAPRLSNVENYLTPGTTVTRNPYESRAAAQYGGFGTFNVPMQSPVMGDPRVGRPPGSYPAAPPPRMQSQVMGDPRVGMPSGAFPSKPASVFADPRVGMPIGAYPQAKPISIVSDPRVSRPPGSYPATRMQSPVMGDPRAGMPPGAYPAAPPMSPFGNVGQEYHKHTAPPTPSQYRNEAPPAAPNVGTPGSQTAETDPSFWQQGKELFNQASTAVKEQVEENKKAVEDIEKKYGPLTPAKVALWSWFNGLGGMGSGKAPPQGTGGGGGYNPAMVMQQALGSLPVSVQPAPQYAQTELAALLDAMRAKGATPEEIAFVESLITQTQAQA